nr:hypothetical protein [Tanacetum cinerariifolium]
VHTLRKECYELLPFPLRFGRDMDRESCGLGFDTSINTWKMVYVLLKEYAPPDKPELVKKNLSTMVHVFGTNSWREISHVSSYPITGLAGTAGLWSNLVKPENSSFERRMRLGGPLLKENIATMVLERATIEEARSLLHWLDCEEGYGKMGVCGLSMGGVHAPVVLSLHSTPVAIFSFLSQHSAVVAFCEGVLKQAMALDLYIMM